MWGWLHVLQPAPVLVFGRFGEFGEGPVGGLAGARCGRSYQEISGRIVVSLSAI